MNVSGPGYKAGIDIVVEGAIERKLEDVVLVVALGIVSVFTVLGNLLVISAFCVDQRLRKTNNLFIASLTLCGLLIGGFSIPMFCLTNWSQSVPFSATVCSMCAFLDNSLATISLWTLGMTSLDRYHMVINYKRYARIVTPGRAMACLIMVWVYGAAVSLPPLIGWNSYHFNQDTDTCGIKYVFDGPGKGFFPFYFFMTFPLPLIGVTFCYSKIFLQAWGVHKRRERRQSQRQSCRISRPPNSSEQCSTNGRPDTPNSLKTDSFSLKSHLSKQCFRISLSGPPLNRSNSTLGSGGMSMNKTIRASLMVFCLVVTYAICTFPIFVFSIAIYFNRDIATGIPGILFKVMTFMFFMNSALNPLMYGVFNTNFRGTFTRVLRCQLPRNWAGYTRPIIRPISRHFSSNGDAPSSVKHYKFTEQVAEAPAVVRLHIINSSDTISPISSSTSSPPISSCSPTGSFKLPQQL